MFTKAEMKLLQSLADGDTLKSHRYIDGTKVYQLHALDGSTRLVGRESVEALYDRGLIETNQKFPAATYWLTEAGHTWLKQHWFDDEIST
ncbi:MAG TPA: hypothetical protein VFK30_05795 [Anaerolineae bacterium]|nr:hypothetical protein [Anaerolineae bacterium]